MLSLRSVNSVKRHLLRNSLAHSRLASHSLSFRHDVFIQNNSKNFSSSSDGKPRSARKFKYIAGFTLLACGGFFYGTYISPEFRLLVEENIPQSRDIFSVILGPPQLGGKKDKKTVKKIKDKEDSTPVEKKQGAESSPIVPPPPPPSVSPPAPVSKPNVPTSSTASSPKPVTPKQAADTFTAQKEERLPSQSDLKRAIKDQDLAAKQSNNDLTEDLVKLIQEVDLTTRRAILSEQELEAKIKAHTEEMSRALNSSDKSAWANVARAFDAKESAKSKAYENRDKAINAQAQLKNKVHVALNNADTKTNPTLIDAMRQLGRYEYDLGFAMFNVHKAQSESTMIVQYRDILDKGRSQFKKELDEIMPIVNPKSLQSDHMTVDQLNSFLIQSNEKIDRLTRKLADLETQEKMRVTAALKQQREEDEALLRERVELELNKLKAQYFMERQSWDQKTRQAWEEDHRKALSLQAALHSDHLTQVMRAQRAEFERDFARSLREHLVKEQEKFQAAIEIWTNRVKGIEAAVEGRAELERQCRESQELWLACHTLYTAITGCCDTMMPLKIPLENIRHTTDQVSLSTSGGKSFVHELINKMPQVAVNRGVVCEEELIERFKKVKKICRRTANVPETGGNIFQYLLAYIQHLWIIDPIKALGGDDEIPNDPKPDTYTLLHGAEKAIQKGNLELAVRFLNQLEGYPRLVAFDWLAEVRLHLEARQIARVLLAFAVARGVTTS